MKKFAKSKNMYYLYINKLKQHLKISDMKTLAKEIKKVYAEKGLNGVHNFLKSNGIKYTQSTVGFGLHTNKESISDKKYWLSEKQDNSVFRFHYYSIGIKSRKTGYGYNILRGTEITLTR